MSAETKLKDFEMAAMQDARQALAKWNGSPGRVFDRNIRRFSSLAKAAGKSVGYLEDRAVRTVFDELGEEIASTWQL